MDGALASGTTGTSSNNSNNQNPTVNQQKSKHLNSVKMDVRIVSAFDAATGSVQSTTHL
jgi:hypothetical protein